MKVVWGFGAYYQERAKCNLLNTGSRFHTCFPPLPILLSSRYSAPTSYACILKSDILGNVWSAVHNGGITYDDWAFADSFISLRNSSTRRSLFSCAHFHSSRSISRGFFPIPSIGKWQREKKWLDENEKRYAYYVATAIHTHTQMAVQFTVKLWPIVHLLNGSDNCSDACCSGRFRMEQPQEFIFSLCGSSESRQSTKEVMGPESITWAWYGIIRTQSGTMTTDTHTLPYATLSMPYIAPAMTLKATPMMIIGGTDCHGMISFGMRCSSLSLF